MSARPLDATADEVLSVARIVVAGDDRDRRMLVVAIVTELRDAAARERAAIRAETINVGARLDGAAHAAIDQIVDLCDRRARGGS